ncbi:hypothetical protein NIES267_41890 [Calothrix parasitica NIES-267]|uniref:Uncharacterized protein n=1 Tax=Calothrix parasitica NIES-267 TaxID=1973488 RepID=A0A1Z4LTY4_9CYAN|nr:hypothetical protein NIES267_41890 [Calothrix parasitica NIES-267]
MIDLTKKSIAQAIKKFIIAANLAVLLIANFAFSPLSAEALPASTDLSRVYQSIGNSDNGILIAHSKNKRTSTREKHQKGEARRKKDQENKEFKEQKRKNKNKKLTMSGSKKNKKGK